MSTLTVTAKGQVTFRKEILAHLGVAPGDKVRVAMLPDGRIALEAAPRGDISACFGLLARPGQAALSLEDINRIAAEGWADREHHR